jgi:hypothetical protein
MTLVLALPTSRFTVQLSDRRLTRPKAGSPGTYVLDTDDGNKAGALQCRDARVAYAFAGLADTGSGFKTSDWLRVALLEAAGPDFLIHRLVHRLAEIATREFSANPQILAVPKSQRKLSVILTGHAMPVSRRPVAQGWTITNYQRRFDTGPSDGVDDAEAWDAFRVWRWHEAIPQSERFGWVLRLGQWQGVSEDQYSRLERLLGEGRPPTLSLEGGSSPSGECRDHFRRLTALRMSDKTPRIAPSTPSSTLRLACSSPSLEVMRKRTRSTREESDISASAKIPS